MKQKKPTRVKRLTKTERLLVINYGMAVGLSILVLALTLAGVESDKLTVLQILATEWIAQTAVFSTLYCWKEKAANRHKYAQKWLSDSIKDERLTPEQAAQFADIVARD